MHARNGREELSSSAAAAAMRSTMSISVIIPVFKDADALARTLDATEWSGVEVIVAATVDDRSALEALRAKRPDVVWIESVRGRARQMNAGAAAARGSWLLFLHADTRLAEGWRAAIDAIDAEPAIAGGCFRFALDSNRWVARAIEFGVRVRVGFLGLPYGDQGIFVRRECFDALHGFADMPIMEDVDFVRRLQRAGSLVHSPLRAVTSARRWERDGWIARTARHLVLITLYFAGVPPSRLIALDRARLSL
jgi:rSAM/selenodomain-associated transferase 2